MLKQKPVDDYPEGYPRLAGYVNSDSNFTMFRMFGTLRCRVLLHQQYEISKLEKKLHKLDDRDDVENNTRIRSIQYDQEKDSWLRSRGMIRSKPDAERPKSKACKEWKFRKVHRCWNRQLHVYGNVLYQLTFATFSAFLARCLSYLINPWMWAQFVPLMTDAPKGFIHINDALALTIP